VKDSKEDGQMTLFTYGSGKLNNFKTANTFLISQQG
jgi:hypothetical protein